MKKLKIITLLVITTLLTNSCSNDDYAVNEDELITTIITTLVSNDQTITLISRDLDGDGPNNPSITTSGNLVVGTTYTGSTKFLNELENPVEDITVELKEEGTDHQVFYQLPSSVGNVTYTDKDTNGKPIGLNFTLVTGNSPTTGTLMITLKHLPNKTYEDITKAGGNTDAAVSFVITVN
jgi:hypothetical protein